MNPLSIVGAASTFTQRRNQPISRQSQSLNRIPQQASNNVRCVQTKSKKSTTKTPMTLPQLIDILETWEDPNAVIETTDAKTRIIDCFKRRSDTLDLSFLYLTSLPDVFDGMQHIIYLSLSNNYFSEIPRHITNLSFLKHLNMSGNVLCDIPDFIREFKHLEIFNAECNQLHKASEELGRLPKLKKLMLAHNRIMKLPGNIKHIKYLIVEDQLPLAAFGDYSPDFAAQWRETFQREIGSGSFEIWLARYEEMLRLPNAEKYRQLYKQRIGTLLDAMVKDSDLRLCCYNKAYDVIATSHDGMLFTLFEMEIAHIEQQISRVELSDEDTRQEIERSFNFHRLKELALLRAQEGSLENNATDQEEIVDAQETVLFYYVSHENTLDMPLDCEIPRYMYQPDMSVANHNHVRDAVEQIRREKNELGTNYLVDFVLEKTFWIDYLSRRYADFIKEHTQVFVDRIEEIEAKLNEMSEYDYLTQMNAAAADKEQSEQKLYHQLTKNILMD